MMIITCIAETKATTAGMYVCKPITPNTEDVSVPHSTTAWPIA